MLKVTILLLLMVPVFGRKPDYNLEETSTDDPSIPVTNSEGTFVLQPNDARLVRAIDFLIDRLNSKFDDEDEALELLEIGKVELKVIDDNQHLFIKNIFTFENLMCISGDGLSEVDLHGSLSIIYDQDENFVKNYIFVSYVPRNFHVPLKELMRRKSISNDIDGEKNANPKRRRYSLNLDMNQLPNIEEE